MIPSTPSFINFFISSTLFTVQGITFIFIALHCSMRDLLTNSYFGEYIFGIKLSECVKDEFEKFDTRYLPADEYFSFAKDYFKSYITDTEFRNIIENKKYALLNTNPNGDVFRKLTPELRSAIPEYIKDYVSLNKFIA